MAYINGGRGTLPAGSTANTLNSTGFDRLLLIHISPISANTVQMWINSTGLTPLSTTLLLSSGSAYDLGPFFVESTGSLVGGMATSSGSYTIDELRV
jgi:hypothetical protein